MLFLKPKIYNLKPRSGQAQPHFSEKSGAGQAALSLVLLVGGTVVLIAATLFFLIMSFINSTFGFQAANRAWALALSGVNDGLLQISRDASFNPISTYYINLDGYTVNVTVFRPCDWGVPGCVDPALTNESQALIIGEATVGGRYRKVKAFISVGPEGKVDVISIEQNLSGDTGSGSPG